MEPLTGALVFVFSFFAMLVDSSLGMGFGTTLSPLLILLGFSPRVVVPSLLLSQLVNGIAAVLSHRHFKNANYKIKSQRNVAMILSLSGIAGVALGVLISINMPEKLLRFLIGTVMIAGALIVTKLNPTKTRLSYPRLIGTGILASFNKSISAGAYGSIVTLGQIASGVPQKSAVAITALSELFVNTFTIIAYLRIGNIKPDISIFALTVLGSLPAAPLAAYIVSNSTRKRLTRAISSLSVALGLLIILTG